MSVLEGAAEIPWAAEIVAAYLFGRVRKVGERRLRSGRESLIRGGWKDRMRDSGGAGWIVWPWGG